MRIQMPLSVILAFVLCLIGCGRKERDFSRPQPGDTVYFFDSQTNRIDGLLVLPEDLMQDDTVVPVIELPRRLYDPKRFSYGSDYTIPWYDFVQDVAKLYDFPISWDPEPEGRRRSRHGAAVGGGRHLNFFEVFREIVSVTQELGFHSRSPDPNEISIGIITKDGAVIKRVMTATDYIGN